jgi:hypothetical protein
MEIVRSDSGLDWWTYTLDYYPPPLPPAPRTAGAAFDLTADEPDPREYPDAPLSR